MGSKDAHWFYVSARSSSSPLVASTGSIRRDALDALHNRRPTIQRLLAIVYLPLVLFVLASGTWVGRGETAEAADHLAFGHTAGTTAQSIASAPLAAITGPSNLQIVPLDSSLHVTWTPSSDPATAWHVASVWEGNTLQGTKVVAKTSRAAQMNGLMPGHSYTVRVQAMDAAGGLSVPVEATAATAPQQPMANAAFFENFNGPSGPLDANYFDVRSSHADALRPESLGAERFLVFNSERHFHTELIGGKQRAELYLRPRVPFDFAGRTGTFQVEVDVAATQHSPGKWWEIHLVRDLPWSAEEFGAGRGDDFPDSIEFSSRVVNGSESQNTVNIPQITVNIGGTVQTFEGSAAQITPTNIRIPVVLRVSETSAELLMNGVSVVKAQGFRLPFTQGYWVLAHRGWYAPRDTTTTPVAFQLVHWETIQFDGPAGSLNPVVRTYIQPGCPGVVRNEHEGIAGCSRLSFSPQSPTQTVTLTIPEDVSAARSARLLFNGVASSSFTVRVNGNPITIPTKSCCYFNALNTTEFPPSWLQQGTNTLEFRYDGSLSSLPDLSQVELEVIYNQPRDTSPAPMSPMAMIGPTNQNFRVDHLASDPTVQPLTTFLYSQGSSNPVAFTASVITPDTPWLTVSPASGSLLSPVLGGGVVPLNLQVNFAGFTTDSDGEVGVVRVDGGSMPIYVAVLAVNDGSIQRPSFISSFTNLTTTFNRAAIPGYSSESSPPGVPEATATPTPTPDEGTAPGGPPSGGAPPPTPTPVPGAGPTTPPGQGPSEPSGRPAIKVAATRDGPGRLRVTVSAADASIPLRSIQFGAAKNGLIDANGQVGSTGNLNWPLPPGAQQVTFTVRRAVQGQAVTVPLTVFDDIGAWPTFVGGGPEAF